MTLTYKQKLNKKFGFEKNKSHSLNEISKLTGYKLSGLKTILSKGEGAYYTNPQSVRKHITSAREWGMARVYSAVMGGRTAKVDSHALIK